MARTPHRLQPTTPLEDNLAYINGNFDVIDDQDLTKIINNGTTPTLLLGYQVGGFNGKDYGLKIAKDGYDVTTTTDNNLAFSSAFDTLKVTFVDSRTITTPATTATYGVTVVHNLGYTPAIVAFIFIVDKYEPNPLLQIDAASGVVTEYTKIIVDDTNIYYKLNVPSSSPLYAAGITRSFKTYLLRETAN